LRLYHVPAIERFVPLAAFETTLGGQPYQVVAHLLYETGGRRQLLGAVGFAVNLRWGELTRGARVNEHYFSEILRQIAAIGHVEESIALGDHRRSRHARRRHPSAGPERGRASESIPAHVLRQRFDCGRRADRCGAADVWSASVGASNDRTLAAAAQGSAGTLWLISIAATVAILGLLLTVRAMKARADLGGHAVGVHGEHDARAQNAARRLSTRRRDARQAPLPFG
jgi:hypothetical protein